MKGLMDTIKESEDEGLEKGLSSYEIEVLWQQKMKERVGQEKARKIREKENQDTSGGQK
jgi:thiamine biosynthesis protein ThiC